MGRHPANIVFLVADAFGVLPLVSRFTPEQAMYHFMAGYTARVAGTERGVTEPQAAFSACFGAPFLPLRPVEYAKLLRGKLARHGSQVWLVNTGWVGGPAGVRERVKSPYTRAMITACLDGTLATGAFTQDPVFGLSVPQQCPGVPAELLRARDLWSDGSAYDAQATDLAARMHEAFAKFEQDVEPAVRAAGPPAGRGVAVRARAGRGAVESPSAG